MLQVACNGIVKIVLGDPTYMGVVAAGYPAFVNWPSLRNKYIYIYIWRPPLWSSGQNFWLQIQRSRVRSPALPDFLSSSGSGTVSTQPREPHEVN